MKDVFEIIDDWNIKLNILRDHSYLQKIALVFSSIMVIFWLVLGFDSGIGMFGWGKIDYKAYGKTFHFSTFVIYGLLFYGLSKHLDKLDIKHSKNTIYSAFLVLFNISVFEWFYFVGFAHYQMHRNLVEWFVNDFLFLQQYLLMLILGLLTFLAFYVDGYIIEGKKVIGRSYRFRIKWTTFSRFDIKASLLESTCSLILFITLSLVLLWIYWPFPVETVTIGGWSSSKFFPQTHYGDVYVRNDLLHLVNVLTKAMFAVTQFYIISRFQK